MQAGSSPSGSHRIGRVVAYTTIVVLAAAVAFVWLLLSLPAAHPAAGEVSPDDLALRALFARTTAVMFVAGVMGACLYNFRGLSKHSASGDYHVNYDLSYFLRPLAGGISGLIVFFLLLGGAMTLNVGTQEGNLAWATLLGRMPYIAFSLLAGYGSHEFMLKLKDLADSLFALKDKEE
ncbi:MAG: hypothetical protein HYT81_10500 [Gemmatimonadetes bacterium]|nr:hypothetical protein [Gemmatimonadota bacterium]